MTFITSLIARFRQRFEQFRAGAGHTVLGKCRCRTPGCRDCGGEFGR